MILYVFEIANKESGALVVKLGLRDIFGQVPAMGTGFSLKCLIYLCLYLFQA